jgi:protein-tyrosine phosphatase
MTLPRHLSSNTLLLQRRRNLMQNTLRPHAASDDSRHLSFEACYNFRDIGGYTNAEGRSVRWRRVFRSMTPQWMTPADVVEAQGLGIELIVDLRGPDHETSGPLGDLPARRLNVGFRRSEFRESPDVQTLLDATAVDGLPMIVDLYAGHFATAITAMTQAEGPVLFHCQLGKDRTGILAALTLNLCGIDDEQVIADYMLTEAREPLCRALIAANNDVVVPEQGARFVREPVQAEAIQAVLRKVETQHGGARGFFVAHGVDGDALDAYVERLLD